jgi:beta-N-acetylhexosaminidase
LPRPAGAGLYVAVDQEGGQVQRLQGPGFSAMPSAVVQGTWPLDQLTTAAAQWGSELRAAGVSVDLAPVADTVPAGFEAQNAPIGQLGREFGSDPEGNGRSAAAFITGMAQAGVQTAVKHFPGLGRVTGNTDFTTEGVADTETTAGDPSFVAYEEALRAGPAMVMVALATYTRLDPDRPAAFSPTIVTGLLRGDLGWDGVVVSDSLSAVAAQALTPAERAVDFVRAGGDLAIFETPDEIQAAWQGLVDEMAADPTFAARVNTSVRRILQAKEKAGLLAPL